MPECPNDGRPCGGFWYSDDRPPRDKRWTAARGDPKNPTPALVDMKHHPLAAWGRTPHCGTHEPRKR